MGVIMGRDLSKETDISEQAVISAACNVTRQSGGKRSLSLKNVEQSEAHAVWRFEEENTSVVFTVQRKAGCLVGSVKAALCPEAFRENDGFAMRAPVELSLTFQKKPERMTALYLHRDWWTRPAFIDTFEKVPDRTQCIYLDYGEDYGCLWLMAGKEYKAMADAGSKETLKLELTACQPGLLSFEETIFVLAQGKHPYDAVYRAGSAVAAETELLPKSRKTFPEIFDYVGWCSWDAFYTDISEEKVRRKAEELERKQVAVRWLLLDDGWLSARENRLYSMIPDQNKFPEGFKKLTADLKANGKIRGIGVWHALGGYWGGVEPESELAGKQARHLYRTKTGKLLPAPYAESGYGFYRDWYEYLRKEGIDFVKVDGQGAIKNYYANDIPLCEAARQTHTALEGAAGAYMGGNLINCMGMAMENIMGRQGSSLSRNSDDFVPGNPEGFAEHLLQNAYNAPYHDQFYYCDWDMFWTSHTDAEKHAILRAVSGGPVYISDRIDETKREVLAPLHYEDGRILRMDRAGMPSADCLFADPAATGTVKITNVADCGIFGRKGGVIAIFNIGKEATEVSVESADIHDLPKGTYYCYDWLSCRGCIAESDWTSKQVLLPGEYRLYLFVPVMDGCSVLGLTDKYVSFHGVEEVKRTKNGFLAVVRECGSFSFHADRKVEKILINGIEVIDGISFEDGLYRVQGTGEGKMLVQVIWKEE